MPRLPMEVGVMCNSFRCGTVPLSRVLMVLGVSIGLWAPVAFAHPPLCGKGMPPVAECGKARTMISQVLEEEAMRSGRALMFEPMEDTDV